MTKTLVEFSKANPNPHGGKCWVCTLPEKNEIDEALRTGQSQPVQIREWLINECGYGSDVCTSTRIAGHVQRRHYVTKPA